MTIRKKFTILIFGEGKSEKAFLDHLRGVYADDLSEQNISVTTDYGNGGSPDDVLKRMVKLVEDRSYRRKILLLDSDIMLTTEGVDRAQNCSIEVLYSVPTCLECMLLRALGQTPPIVCKACKSKFQEIVSDPTDFRTYKSAFSRDVLETIFEGGNNLSGILDVFKKPRGNG